MPLGIAIYRSDAPSYRASGQGHREYSLGSRRDAFSCHAREWCTVGVPARLRLYCSLPELGAVPHANLGLANVRERREREHVIAASRESEEI